MTLTHNCIKAVLFPPTGGKKKFLVSFRTRILKNCKYILLNANSLLIGEIKCIIQTAEDKEHKYI